MSTNRELDITPLPRMKVSVTVTIEVDRENWGATYDVGTGAAEVRSDARSWIENVVQSWADCDPDGKIVNAEIRR